VHTITLRARGLFSIEHDVPHRGDAHGSNRHRSSRTETASLGGAAVAPAKPWIGQRCAGGMNSTGFPNSARSDVIFPMWYPR